MRKMILLLAITSVMSSCSTDKKTDTSDTTTTMTNLPSDEDGWVSLFDGKTTNGWHGYGGKDVPIWQVQDSALFLNVADKAEKGDQYLVTDEEYGDFELKMEWKISKNGNSGIILFVHEDTVKYQHPYSSGPEMQVLDNEGHPDAKIVKHRAGDLYDLIASKKETVKPAGEWNEVRIISNKGKLDFFLNGENIVSTTLWDDNWRQLIAGSKFAEWPGFGTYKSGRIALQDHGDNVWYRNIMIKRL